MFNNTFTFINTLEEYKTRVKRQFKKGVQLFETVAQHKGYKESHEAMNKDDMPLVKTLIKQNTQDKEKE